MQEKYFVASNSSEGFCSYYDNAFDIDKFSRIYAIKGGSGTGKAFFMKAVASEAEKRGYSVRYIYCSSDAASLDGIIIKELSIAVLDGTAPHIYEPKLVGAVDSIVDLGAFLNTEMLSKSRSVIENLNLAKGQCFKNAYGYLKAYGAICENIERLVRPAIKFDKLKNVASRFAKNLEAEHGIKENLLVRSIGMRGLSSFDTYFENAGIYYEVNDCFDTAHIFMNEIYSSLNEKRVNMRISNNPIIPERFDAVCASSSGLTFEISNDMNESSRTINMKRFIDGTELAKIRRKYREAARIRDDILSLALEEFEKVKKYHFILEEIYGSAMDFDAKEEYTARFCNKIFKNN